MPSTDNVNFLLFYWTICWLEERMDKDCWPVTYYVSQPCISLIQIRIENLHNPPDRSRWDIIIGIAEKDVIMNVFEEIETFLMKLPPSDFLIRKENLWKKLSLKPTVALLDDVIGLQTDAVRIVLLIWIIEEKINNKWKLKVHMFYDKTCIWPIINITFTFFSLKSQKLRILIQPKTTWRDIIKYQAQIYRMSKSCVTKANMLYQILRQPTNITQKNIMNSKCLPIYDIRHFYLRSNYQNKIACKPAVNIIEFFNSKCL